MQSQLRLSDSPGTAATIHWQYLLSHRTILPWREVAQVLRGRLPAGDQIPLQKRIGRPVFYILSFGLYRILPK